MPTSERRLADGLAASLDRRSLDIPMFTYLLSESADNESLRRVIVYLITYGAIAYANGDNDSILCMRLYDTLKVYGEAVIDIEV